MTKFARMTSEDKGIVNKVAESGLISLDLGEWVKESELALFDLAPLLLDGYFLKEKEFRSSLSELDASTFSGKWTGIYCSTDAIIQKWAWMLTAKTLLGLEAKPLFSGPEELKNKVLLEKIREINPEDYRDARVVVKGCGEKFVTGEAYLELTKRLIPVVKSLMYGEPCSTVPVFKRK